MKTAIINGDITDPIFMSNIISDIKPTKLFYLGRSHMSDIHYKIHIQHLRQMLVRWSTCYLPYKNTLPQQDFTKRALRNYLVGSIVLVLDTVRFLRSILVARKHNNNMR
jgi:hypothetical protein